MHACIWYNCGVVATDGWICGVLRITPAPRRLPTGVTVVPFFYYTEQ